LDVLFVANEHEKATNSATALPPALARTQRRSCENAKAVSAPALAQPPGELRPELSAPGVNALVSNSHARSAKISSMSLRLKLKT
jgi:hypothetical protein